MAALETLGSNLDFTTSELVNYLNALWSLSTSVIWGGGN